MWQHGTIDSNFGEGNAEFERQVEGFETPPPKFGWIPSTEHQRALTETSKASRI